MSLPPDPLRTARKIIALILTALSNSTAALAQDPLKRLPENYRLTFDNPDVAVIRAHYGPHEKIPVHDHAGFATVFVYLNNSGQVRIDHVEETGTPTSVIRPPTVKGSYRVAPGIAERHSIENLGDSSSDFLRVELKHVSLNIDEPFRGKAPDSLSVSLDRVEFANPALQIERILCTGPAPCPIKSSPSPSLIVAFTPLSLAFESAPEDERLQAGAVRWLPPSTVAALTPDAASPAHLLRILLPAASR